MTKAHNDRIIVNNEDRGYSIRVGKKLPPNVVNLAYVHTPQMEPRKNLLVTDVSGDIVENSLAEVEDQQTLVYPDDSFLLREINKPFYTSTKNVLLTDEFTVPQTTQQLPVPLYYKAELAGWFDATGASITYYPSGYLDTPITNGFSYSQLDPAKASDDLLYLGSKIRITNQDGTPLSKDKQYKIRLIKQTGGTVPLNAYSIMIYTNFRGTNNATYIVHYEKYIATQSHINDFTEVLNAYPFFTEVDKSILDDLALNPKSSGDWRIELQGKQYAIIEDEDHMWQIYAPSQVIIADNATRPAHQFKYRVKGKLRTKFTTDDNLGSINIGMLYLNQSVANVEDLTAVLKKVYEHPLRPAYIDFVNPHHGFDVSHLDATGILDLKQNPLYWNVDITMPSDYLNDYDLIIITGYSSYNMALYNDALRTYLENGGRVWVDNAGAGVDSLSLDNFLINIGFSTSLDSTGSKAYGIPDNELDSHDVYSIERRAVERLYLLDKTSFSTGYAGVNSKITYGLGEDSTLWTPIIRYSSGDPAMITRSIYGIGQLIFSNCGIFRAISSTEADDIKLAINIILSFAEERNVSTPWIQEYVYHRDNLFKEEYKNLDTDLYIDDRNDYDSSQIVAKKILGKTVRDSMIPYMPSSYYKANGTFTVEVAADKQILVQNADFEIGTVDPATHNAVTNWTVDTTDAIPGWSTKIVSGSPVFDQVSSLSQRGRKAITISSTTAAQGYWYSAVPQLIVGAYKATVWMKTDTVTGIGAVIAIYKSDGTLITTGEAVTGTRDWVKIEVNFSILATTDIEIRLGFLDTGVQGTTYIDYMSIVGLGDVLMTPDNNGESALYAYATKPHNDTFNLNSQGFTLADITVYDPEVEFNYSIQSFVYVWDNSVTQYVRSYGSYKTYTTKIRRSDGIISLGLLTTLLPGLNAGADWADKTKVFYQIVIGSNQQSNFVNVAFFNTKTGTYFYTKNGENIIGYTELLDNGSNQLGVIAQCWTDYYTIRATKRRYAVKPQNNEKIYLEYPSTIDPRDAWFLRVHNGGFVKTALNYKETLTATTFYTDRDFGTHKYSLPEYDRQLFKPGMPYRRVRKEVCEFINESTVKVQNTPLYVNISQRRGELATAITTKAYKALDGDWSSDFVYKVYIDTGAGVFIEATSGFKVDPLNGIVTFDVDQTAVKLDYNINNLTLYKRSYNNTKVKREALTTVDNKIFLSKNRNWMLYPSPIVYRVPYAVGSEGFIAPVDTYEIDYDNGSIRFKSDTNDNIFVTYNYSTDVALVISDYDVQNGLIYLEDDISFKDEVYANYYYEEHFVEYRGFYDDSIGQFVHLDLNPAQGHYFTLPTLYQFPVETRYEEVPTAQLMNKEVYVYIVPYQTSFGDINQYTIRHCYSKAEWEQISATMPGIALLLGVIQLRESAQVSDSIVLDTRMRGGGLKETISNTMIKNRDQGATSFWDMGLWDGMAYYSNGVVIIQIPSMVLQSQGGQFSEQDIDRIIKKYIAYGVYYIIEYV